MRPGAACAARPCSGPALLRDFPLLERVWTSGAIPCLVLLGQSSAEVGPHRAVCGRSLNNMLLLPGYQQGEYLQGERSFVALLPSPKCLLILWRSVHFASLLKLLGSCGWLLTTALLLCEHLPVFR